MKPIFTLLTALLFVPLAALQAVEPPHILIREALQFENIGDSGRVPGTIRLLYQHLPDATVTLWPWQLHEREREMLMRAFPTLRVAEGEVDDLGKASTPALAEAWKDADIFITPARHAKTFQTWAKSGRPYGFFGSSFDPVSNRKDRPQGRLASRCGMKSGRRAGCGASAWRREGSSACCRVCATRPTIA
ncbi:MAG: hypothetical protein EBR81_09820 [Proteobacteria bacterium]|nr:hypothetical protein [Pseudomonadota bacterium]